MKERKTIRLQPVLLMLVILAAILTAILLFTSYQTRAAYMEMQAATEKYIACQTSAEEMQIGSDNLTKQAQSFAVTGETRYMDGFFEEANVTRNRDKALENLKEEFSGTPAYEALENAMERSNELMQKEYYSMRLIADCEEIPEEQLPEELRHMELTPEDAALSAEEKRALALEMVFGEEYEATKESITEAVGRCIEALQAETRRNQIGSSNQMVRFLNLSYVLIAAMLIIVFVTFLLTILLALRPLWRAIGRIKEKELIPETGSYEVRYLARTYNHMFEKNQLHQDKLSYEATHDPLTDLYNRGVFEDRLPSFEEHDNAMILLDVDYFKQMNDTYGHQVGDQALQKLAKALHDSFRGEDYVCRIGGDEFAVIMVNVGEDMKPLVETKLNLIRSKIAEKDEVPPFTLSIGVAFSKDGLTGADVFNNADAALYDAKNQGRNSYTFH